MLSVSFPATAATDNILSANIKEAVAGSTDQNTNSGSGVKTGHIADAAVTTAKIADGAITDAKVSGLISGSKVSPVGLDADSVDGKHADDLAAMDHSHDSTAIVSGTLSVERLATYSGLRIVHNGPADGVNTFTTIGSALDSILDASPERRYLVRVMPGLYAESVTMKEFVDIQGAGTEGVQIRHTEQSALPTISWNVSNAVLSGVTIGTPSYYARGALKVSAGSAILRDVAVVMDTLGGAFVTGIENAGELRMERCTLQSRVGMTGLYSYGPSLIVSESSIEVDGGDSTNTTTGVYVGGPAVLRNSQINVSSPVRATAINTNASAPVKVINCDISAIGTMLANGLQATYPGLVIDNSRIEVTCTNPEGAHAIAGFGVKVNGSSLTSNGYALTGSVDVTNSTVSPFIACLTVGSTARMAGSQILGGATRTTGVGNVVNCYDENFSPIPDVP